MTAITLDAAATEITSRERGEYVVTAEFADGSTADVTADAAVSVDDEALAKVYEAGFLQPIDAGSVVLTASYETFSADASFTISVVPAVAGDLIINEVLSDGSAEGDPNGDGTLESTEDEYVEIANGSDVTVDLSGVTIFEEHIPEVARHTFAEGTILKAGQAIVVFGGGDASSLSADNASFVVADNEDSALPYGLALKNDGDRIKLMAADGVTVITELAYGDIDASAEEAILDASLTLSPDVWGTDYTHHKFATDSIGDYSPGTYLDGSAFPGPDGRYGAE